MEFAIPPDLSDDGMIFDSVNEKKEKENNNEYTILTKIIHTN